MLTLTTPHASADALRWRASTLDVARSRARTLGLEGATFPWRTIDGQEASGYWPAGTAAFHVNADIARAFEDYRLVTGDETLERECGLEVLMETARVWSALGIHDRNGSWHIDGVTGPDEYTALANDNVFTNLMAARNLCAAADACDRHPDLARDLGVSIEETAAWRDAAAAVHIPYDEALGVHPQCESFTRYGEWDFEATRDQRPLLLHAPYVRLYSRQVIKQADVVLAMHWCGDAFTADQKARNLDYYERRNVRDSSLSAGTQAVICAEVGQLQLAHDYLREAALLDLYDLHGNTHGGLHLAGLAGAWAAVVEGFGGLRRHADRLSLAPCLPAGIERVAFRVRWRAARLLVEMTHDEVRCALPGQPDAHIPIRLYGEDLELTGTRVLRRPMLSPAPLLPAPSQPAGRAPSSVVGTSP